MPLRELPRPNGGREVAARSLNLPAPAYVGAKVTEVKALDALVAELNRDELLTLRKALDTRLGGNGADASRLLEAFNVGRWRR